MTREDLLTLFSELLGDLLATEAIALRMETRREDVPGWDSFTYVNFIVAVEIRCAVKFTLAEVESFQNVGEVVDRTLAILSGKR